MNTVHACVVCDVRDEPGYTVCQTTVTDQHGTLLLTMLRVTIVFNTCGGHNLAGMLLGPDHQHLDYGRLLTHQVHMPTKCTTCRQTEPLCLKQID
jgi:hypothetical protein